MWRVVKMHDSHIRAQPRLAFGRCTNVKEGAVSRGLSERERAVLVTLQERQAADADPIPV